MMYTIGRPFRSIPIAFILLFLMGREGQADVERKLPKPTAQELIVRLEREVNAGDRLAVINTARQLKVQLARELARGHILVQTRADAAVLLLRLGATPNGLPPQESMDYLSWSRNALSQVSKESGMDLSHYLGLADCKMGAIVRLQAKAGWEKETVRLFESGASLLRAKRDEVLENPDLVDVALECHGVLAQLYGDSGRDSRAEQTMQAFNDAFVSDDLSPRIKFVYLSLHGVTKEWMRDYTSARDYYERALELTGSFGEPVDHARSAAQTHTALGRVAISASTGVGGVRRNFRSALKQLQKVPDSEFDRAEIRYKLGFVLDVEDRSVEWRKALEDLEKQPVTKRNQYESQFLTMQLRLALAGIEPSDRASEEYGRVIDLAGSDRRFAKLSAHAHAALASLYFAQGHRKRAAFHGKRAVRDVRRDVMRNWSTIYEIAPILESLDMVDLSVDVSKGFIKDVFVADRALATSQESMQRIVGSNHHFIFTQAAKGKCYDSGYGRFKNLAIEVAASTKALWTTVRSMRMAELRTSQSEEVQQALAEHARLSHALAREVLRPSEESQLGELAFEMTASDARIAALASENGAVPPKWISVDDIQRSLSDGEWLFDYVWYRPVTSSSTASAENARYLGLVVSNDVACAVDLGEATLIDEKVDSALDHLRTQAAIGWDTSETVGDLHALEKAAFHPLLSVATGVKRLYLVPAGALMSIPFEALPTRVEGKSLSYAVEQMDLVYQVSARNIVHKPRRRKIHSEREALVVADPRYDDPGGSGESAVGASRGGSWSRIDSTSGFGKNVSEKLRNAGVPVRLLLGEKASERAIAESEDPSLLVIATHGAHERLFRSLAIGSMKLDEDGMDIEFPFGQVDQAMYSQLVLAGANRKNWDESSDGYFDGLLSAFEMMALDLDSTAAAILVACDSVLGPPWLPPPSEGGAWLSFESGWSSSGPGESRTGMREALEIAGVPVTVGALWSVPATTVTEETGEMLDGWLLNGEVVYRSFRDAQLAALARSRSVAGQNGHPIWWAGLVYYGEPGGRP